MIYNRFDYHKILQIGMNNLSSKAYTILVTAISTIILHYGSASAATTEGNGVGFFTDSTTFHSISSFSFSDREIMLDMGFIPEEYLTLDIDSDSSGDILGDIDFHSSGDSLGEEEMPVATDAVNTPESSSLFSHIILGGLIVSGLIRRDSK